MVLVRLCMSKSTAMVMSERSVHLATLFSWAVLIVTIILLESAGGRRMAIEIIAWSIFMKVQDRVWIKLMISGSAVRHVSVVRHFTGCATRPDKSTWFKCFVNSFNNYNGLKCFTSCCFWEHSGSVVECLTRDGRAEGSNLTGLTALWSLSKTHLS